MAHVPPYDPFRTDGEDNSWLGGWLSNFIRISSKGNTPKSLANIPSPYLEYAIYCTFKTVETAAFVGGICLKPFYAYYLRRKVAPEKVTPNTDKIVRATYRIFQGRLLIASLFVGPLVVTPVAVYLNGFTRASLKQRCYDIRCDDRNIFHDRSTLIMGWMGWYWRRFQGAVDFINVTNLYTAFRYGVLKRWTAMTGMEMQLVGPEERYASPGEAELDMNSLTRFFLQKRQQHRLAGEQSEKQQQQQQKQLEPRAIEQN